MFILQFKLILDHEAYVAAHKGAGKQGLVTNKNYKATQGRHDEDRREGDRTG